MKFSLRSDGPVTYRATSGPLAGQVFQQGVVYDTDGLGIDPGTAHANPNFSCESLPALGVGAASSPASFAPIVDGPEDDSGSDIDGGAPLAAVDDEPHVGTGGGVAALDAQGGAGRQASPQRHPSDVPDAAPRHRPIDARVEDVGASSPPPSRRAARSRIVRPERRN